ncbi:coiled-coil domain-containing protein 191-like [Branchiostoma lanceolatum]|uniref:coiled-coil domain-containing protein 191-like n=1 Tax=Branchiostoma lanceolatum TaxID=7740 RepID=UPI003453A029
MAQSNPSLFKWRRRTEKFPSQSQTGDSSGALSKQSLTAVDDVQDWIKKVQKASDRAAVAALGPRAAGRTNGHAAALETVDQLREHDATYNEAQELLSTWMSEKVNLDFDVDDEDWSEVPSAKATAGNSPADGMLDSLLEENYTFTDDTTDGSASQRARDFYSRIEDDDDDSAVQQILSGMMDLEVLDDSTLKELEAAEDSRPRKDPNMTMEMRHRKVKEARDRRQRELEQKRRAKQRKKDAKFQAAQMVLREEREKALRAKREEEEIQHIMAHMRKEMYEQQRLEMEAREKERQMREADEARLLEQRQRQREDLDSEYLRHWQKEEEDRLRQLNKNAEVDTLRRRHNLRCLQRHFSAWYRLIVARRVQYGKARAMADWKATLRAWNAWRTYVLSKKTDKETRKYQRDLVHMKRKQQAAVEHDRRRVLQRCLQAWVLYAHWEQDRKELYRKQEETRTKMSALLEAAASGKLWSARQEEEEDITSGRGGVRSDRMENGQRTVDELFEEPVKRQASAPLVRTDRSEPVSSRSEKDKGKHARRLAKPTEPWQVNKKHLGLSNNALAHLTQLELANQDRQEKDKLVQPKKPYVPNTYEHRYSHQQQALEEQKRQIKEQKRLIEELQEQQRLIICQQDMQKATAAREAIEEAIAGQGAKGQRSRPDSARSDSTDASSAMSQTDTCVSGPSTAVSRNSSSSKSRAKALQDADPIVKKMEERAALREEKKRRIEERKRRKEEEKVLRLQEEEEARRQAEEEEKRARLERVREEKRLIKQRELEKQERLERQAQLNATADEHYRNSLLRNKGWAAWRKLVGQSRHNMQVAVDHHTEELLRHCLVPWYDYTQEILQHKADMATEFCNFISVRRCFWSWRRYGQHQSILEARAERHRQLRMREKCFRLWMDYAMEERLAGIEKDRMAVDHNVIRLQKKAFRAWQQLPVLAKKERERERRRTEMRKKVANILPDFQGLQLAEDKEDFTCSLGNIKMKL